MVQQRAADVDQPVLALASRHPLILRDIQRWVALNPEATRIGKGARPRLSLRRGDANLLVNWDPAGALEQMGRGGSRVVQLFGEVSDLLQFLTRPEAARCAAHADWTPLLLLPLQHALHLQQWLQTMHPRQWPWPLLEEEPFEAGALGEPARGVGRQMEQFLQQICARKQQRLIEMYTGWPTPKQVLEGRERPLRAVAFALAGSAYQQFCARDLADALGAAGVEARAVIPPGRQTMMYELLEAMEQLQPDVLLLNGRDREHFPGLPRELCILAWDQDYALSSSAGYARHTGPRDMLMVMVDEWREDAKANGVAEERMAHVNLGVNQRLYHPPAEPVAAQFDLLFVGNIYPFEAYRKIIQLDRLDEISRRLMLHGRERLREWLESRTEEEPFVIPDLDTFLRECLHELGHAHSGDERHWRFLVNYFRYRVAHLLVREIYVSSLTDLRLGLFGRGWESFAATAAHARPEIENGPALRDAIHRSAINLHLHTWTVHHPRLYDTAAAGGFLLAGRVPEAYPLERVFAGDEVDSFGSIAELKRKIGHYLAHPQERLAMAERAARRARTEHSMEQRVRDMTWLLTRDVYDQHG